VHINLHGIKAVNDNIAIARKAMENGDSATAAQATPAAQQAFNGYVQDVSQNHASTVGDWLAIERAGEQFGDTKVQSYAAGRARNQAAKDVAAASKADPCTIKQSDFDCAVRMLVTAQLIGAPDGDALASAQKISQAIDDRSTTGSITRRRRAARSGR
jgi:hypothetical protein